MQANDAIGEICSPPFHCFFLFKEGFEGGGGWFNIICIEIMV